jgi:hypothetical protein
MFSISSEHEQELKKKNVDILLGVRDIAVRLCGCYGFTKYCSRKKRIADSYSVLRVQETSESRIPYD